MHKQYGQAPKARLASNELTWPGPILRISPSDVHVNDPTFIDQVYAGPGKRREKGQHTINGLGLSPTGIATKSHDLHRRRRAALNPFFSTQRVRRLEPMVHEVLTQLFQRLEQRRQEDRPVNMSLLYRAATHDLIANYAFGQGSICFRREDLNEPYFQGYHEMVIAWHIGCYFPWIGRIMRKLPPAVVAALMPSSQHFIDMINVSYGPKLMGTGLTNM